MVPPGEVTACAQFGRRLGRAVQQLGRPGHRGAGQPCREAGRQPRLLAGLGQAFGEMEDIGRPGAGNRRHRVDEPLVVEPFDAADRGE